jgi:precorrin-4 C11-methyltransferase
MTNGTIIFVGAGPGAPDLITCRGRAALERADVIIYAGSLVNEQLLEWAPRAERFNSAGMTLEQVLGVMTAAYRQGRTVVRLHTGDPAMYGAVAEQYRELDRLGIPFEVVPGVSSVFAAAAALQTEFTMPGITQTAILTRDAGRTPVPEAEDLEKLAAHGTTLALFLSVGDMDKLTEKLLRAGRSPATPAAVVYRAGWANEKIVRGTIADIAAKVRAADIKRQSIIVIGEVLARSGETSLLYGENFAHGYRAEDHFNGCCAVFALTENGAHKAAEIAAGLASAVIVLPEKLKLLAPASRVVAYPQGGLHDAVMAAWREYDGLIMIMASGIVVRAIAGLCGHKSSDPAVVVCDEQGNYAVSLLSGHLGGANRLAVQTARITGGKPVITTASDGRGILAFDELAAIRGWRIANPELLTEISARILDGEAMDIAIPPEIYDNYYAAAGQFRRNSRVETPCGAVYDGSGVLHLVRRPLVLGVGCRRGATARSIAEAVKLSGYGTFDQIVTIDKKLAEPGLVEFAASRGLSLRGYSVEELNRADAPNPSPRAIQEFGVHSVAEAAAILASGNPVLTVEKIKHDGVTVAVGMGISCDE